MNGINDEKLLLSICIPTYNRKEGLIRQLKCIERQNCKVPIVISDNASNYDVEKLIKETFNDQFASWITVTRRIYNCGGDYNITSCFLQVKTRWMWLLSDDDEVLPDSLRRILELINLYPDAIALKFSVYTEFEWDLLYKVASLEDLLNGYEKKYYTGGEMIFISNNVYNMDELNQNIGKGLMYNQCSLGHIIPIISSLNGGEKYFIFSSSKIVKYCAPTEQTGWNHAIIVTSISQFLNVNIGLSYKEKKKLFFMLTSDFEFLYFVRDCLKLPDKEYRMKIYYNGLRTIFNMRKSFVDYMLRFIFLFQHFTGINVLGCLYSNKERLIKFYKKI